MNANGNTMQEQCPRWLFMQGVCKTNGYIRYILIGFCNKNQQIYVSSDYMSFESS